MTGDDKVNWVPFSKVSLKSHSFTRNLSLSTSIPNEMDQK